MRYYISLIAIALISISVIAACQQNAPTTNTAKTTVAASPKTEEHEDNAPRISLEEAKKAFDAGNAFIIDTRPEGSYKQEHIKGAVNITSDAVASRLSEIPKDKKVIAYCS